MRVAMHNWMRAEPIEVTIARLARSGYDAIEISGEPDRYYTRDVGKLLKHHDLSCWGSVTLMLGTRNLLAGSAKHRATSVTYVKDTITMVKELGGEEITIVPGTVGKLTPDASAEDEWKWAVESLKQCYEHGLKEGVRLAIERARAAVGHLVKIEVEVDTLAQLDEALSAGVDAVLLDNMPTETLREAVRKVGGRAITEASGGVTLASVQAVAATGVDIISAGWLTHSAPILDLGLDVL